VAPEVLIHRLDAELTAGAVTGVDADPAADGVDEVPAYFFRGPSWAQFTAHGPADAAGAASLPWPGTYRSDWFEPLGQEDVGERGQRC
jgi:hypothetical protein